MQTHGQTALQQPNLLETVDAHEHPELIARLQRELDLDLPSAQQLFADMKRYLYLCTISGEKLAPTPKIDAAWHEFLMYTRDYTCFCQQMFGTFVHHTPNPTLTPHEVLDPNRTFQLAQQTFGELGPNWDVASDAECSPDSDCHADGSCGGDV